MNKIPFVFLIISHGFGYSQSTGQHPELLLNKEVKILPLDVRFQEYGYRDLYKTAEMRITDKAIKYSTVVNKIFKVTEVVPFEEYGAKKFKITLESSKNGTYYYEYDPRFEYKDILEVIGGLEIH